MEIHLVVLAIVLVMLATLPNASASSADEFMDCNQTEYTAYRECVHNRYRRQLNGTTFADDRHIILNSTEPIVSAVINSTGSQSLLTGCKRLNFDCRIVCANDTECEKSCPVCPLNAAQVSQDYQTVVLETVDGETEQFQVNYKVYPN